MPELSVVIPTTIEDDEDVPAVDYLRRCSYDDYELVIRRDEGASQARNAGIREATSDKLVFLDDDSMPRDGHLRAAAAALSDHDAVAGRVFQPPDAPFADKDLPWYDQGDEPKRTNLLPGCNMAMRKSLLERVGTFNESLPWGHEETDLALRICEETYIYYEPSMVVDHYFAESVWAYWKKSHRHGIADVQWWRVNGTAWHEQFLRSLPVFLPRENLDAVEFVSLVSKRLGRIRGHLFGR